MSRLGRAIAASFGGGFGPLLTARMVQIANGFATSVAIVWSFGLAAAGTYAIGLVGLSILSLVTALGLPSSLPHGLAACSDGRKAAAGLIATALVAVPAAVASLLFGWATGHSGGEALAIAVFAVNGHLVGQGTVLQTLLVMQRRARFAPLPHLAQSAGIAIAAAAASGLVEFAVILLASRLAGNVAGFAALQMERVGAKELRASIMDARGFLSVDVLVQLGLQLPLLLLSYLLSREAMGVFGICRQIQYAALTPGWCFVQSRYPELVVEKLRAAPEMIRRNRQLAVAVAAAAMAATIILAFMVYRLPVLVPAMALLLLALPGGYASYLYDTFIRATGNLRTCNELAAVRALSSIGIFWLLADAFHFWGAIVAAALVELLSAVIYWWRFHALQSRADRACVPQLIPSAAVAESRAEPSKP